MLQNLAGFELVIGNLQETFNVWIQVCLEITSAGLNESIIDYF